MRQTLQQSHIYNFADIVFVYINFSDTKQDRMCIEILQISYVYLLETFLEKSDLMKATLIK